jgi:hypothetical protein
VVGFGVEGCWGGMLVFSYFGRYLEEMNMGVEFVAL